MKRAARALAGLAVLAACAVGAGWLALARYEARLPPLDLGEAARGSAVVLAADGKLLRAFVTEDDRWRLPVSQADVDPRFLAMLIAYEDRRFQAHSGVDWRAALRAAGQGLAQGRVVSGASTLTMQAARLLEPREERSFAAKARQAVRARQIESRLSKAQILDLYLALAPYGGNVEGLRAAAFAWFGKEPRRLSVAESALLVALPQAPETSRPDRYPEAARRARDRVLDRMVRAGIVAPAEAERARAEPVPTERRPFPLHAPHMADALVRERPDQRSHRTTLDFRLQTAFEALVRERVQGLDPRVSAAIIAIDVDSGHILADVGSPDYLSAERGGGNDMVRAVRSPGSALKPFIYALAFEAGVAHPETMLEDRPSRFGGWAPENFDMSFTGSTTARKALQLSLNLPAVDLLAEIGPPQFMARLRTAGARIETPPEAAPGLAIGLGGLGVRLVDMTMLFAGLARGGETLAPWRRAEEAGTPPHGRRLVDPAAAWYVADILKDAPAPPGGATGRIAFKTGTSYGYRDAWAIGFDRRIAIGVWLGRPDNGAVPGLIGRQVAAPILFDAFARLGREPEPTPRPASALVARTASLPPPLRHLRKDAPKTLAGALTPLLRIAFPPEGARVEAARIVDGEPPQVALKVNGGVGPFTWFINGAPVGAPEPRRQGAWRPDGPGFARVSVTDAKGASHSVVVRVE